VVVSIDGRPHVHDAVRKTPSGDGSYARVAENAKSLLLHRKGEYYVRGTFTADNLDFAEDVLHVADLGFAGVSIEPVVTKAKNAIREEHLPAIFAEYERLAAEYLRRRREGNGLRSFTSWWIMRGAVQAEARARLRRGHRVRGRRAERRDLSLPPVCGKAAV
jgi:uncharacterized protein